MRRSALATAFTIFCFCGNFRNTSGNTLKSLCSKNSDSECDVGWAPIPNLGAALVGYDLPTGNPFSDNFIEDPGLRSGSFCQLLP